MVAYFVRRLLYVIPTMFLVSIVSFIIIELPPGDVTDTYQAQLAEQDSEKAPEIITGLKEQYGLDRPVHQRYFIWVWNLIRGDFGQSILYNQPVGSIIGSRLALTAIVALSTLAFTWLVGIPIGIYSAVHQYSLLDHIFTFFAFIGRSIPNFLLALLLMILGLSLFDVSVGGLFSNEYVGEPWSLAKLGDFLAHLWVPVVVVGTAGTASVARMMRGNLLDVLNMQYVQTARSKGLRERVVVYKHAVRNALQPLIMAFGMEFPNILSGATVTSIVLSLPTLGPVLLTALRGQDMYLAGTILFFQVLLLVIGNLFADLALALVDPRVSYE